VSEPEKTATIYVVIHGDARPVQRSCRAAEARVDDVVRPERLDALNRLLDPATVIRKALGEFDG
jgi:hypothetical protein